MEPKYTTTTVYSLQEYKRFAWAMLFHRQLVIRILLIVAALVALGAGLGNWYISAFGLAYPLLLWLSRSQQMRRNYESNKAMQNMTMVIDFYEDYLIQRAPHGESRIYYNELFRILETSTNFYLLLGRNQGTVLVKANFPEGLADFLRAIVLLPR